MSYVNSKTKRVFRSKEIDRSYRLFPKRRINLSEIKYKLASREELAKYERRIRRQLCFYEENGYFQDEILVSINTSTDNNTFVLEAGYPVLAALSQLGIKTAEVRIKVKVNKDKAHKLVTKRLSDHNKAVEMFIALDTKMEKLRQIIHTCDSDLYDLMNSVDVSLQSVIKEAHFKSINTSHVYKKSLKAVIYK
ncbi:hypothetical protein [Priestia flexa]|uniref:hypothetical protein n=1 Tax=Priestia flexa TaxID=86664 RepID=UPI00077CBA86|nr:hypothetical protein [Priestia flexa]MED4587865.1 hypothetical protein [Priestia flexa]